MHVVVMFEPALPGENLKLSEQVNEVFGPFKDGEEAERWTETAEKLIKNRQWLIIPLSSPMDTLDALNPERN
jgi:hypothetical protein